MYDTHVLVVGGGYVGACVAQKLCEANIHHIHIDNREKNSGSRASSGIVSPKWVDYNEFTHGIRPGWWNSDHSRASRLWVAMLEREGLVVKYAYDQWKADEITRGAGVSYIASDHSLLLGLGKPLFDELVSMDRHLFGWKVRLRDRFVKARFVVLATGVWTSDILAKCRKASRFSVGSAKGVGWAIKPKGDKEIYEKAVFGRSNRSSVNGHVIPWGAVSRLGDVVEKNRLGCNASEEEQKFWLEKLANKVYWEWEFVEEFVGFRPVTRRLCADEITPGLIVATGGRRKTLGYVGGMALRVSQLVKESYDESCVRTLCNWRQGYVAGKRRNE